VLPPGLAFLGEKAFERKKSLRMHQVRLEIFPATAVMLAGMLAWKTG
jgi:hypothetical protein